MNRHWLKVYIGAVIEVVWVIGLAHAYDFWTWTGTLIAIVVSNYLMISAAQILPASTVYAIYVGLGTAGTVAAEILFFGVPFQGIKVVLITTLLAGVIGLQTVTVERRPREVTG